MATAEQDGAVRSMRTIGGKLYVDLSSGEDQMIKMNGQAAELPPGWRPDFLYIGFKPLYLLALKHFTGRTSTWFLNPDMERIGFDQPDQLAPLEAQILRDKAPAVLRALREWTRSGSAAPVAGDVEGFLRLGQEIKDRIRQFCEGDETEQEAADDEPALAALYSRHNGGKFLTPSDLSKTPLVPKRVALVGSCLLSDLNFHKRNPSGCPVDLLVVNHADPLPERPSRDVEISDYDFLVVQIPLRAILLDGMFSHLDYGQIDAYQDAFEAARERLEFHLRCRMEWNEKFGILTFVSNFIPPQRNPMGALFPKFDLRNPEYFITKLNEELEALVRGYLNAYVLDVDRIASSIGRRHIQDDIVNVTSHGSTMNLPGLVPDRIEPLAPMLDHYDLRWPSIFCDSIWAELLSMYRIVRQVDAVKLVVVDLDDTLWSGVSGDMADVGPEMVEGWPLGIAEALTYLKKRGILLAIVSKNDEQRIREIWPKIFYGRLALDDFAAVFINWSPKAESMRALLEVTNLLPRNVLFIDDNPAERAAMRRAFPDMRILGRYPYYLRRILLWSSETQVPSITDESGRRTEMVRRQVEREGQRKQLSRDDFLREAAPRVNMMLIDNVQHPRFPRAFELLNKTNQFNTTGRRWKTEELQALLRGGAWLLTFEVVDKYTDYGLVGVVIVTGSTIEQWVMSCRVLGYQIEEAVMSVVVRSLRTLGGGPIIGRLIETDVNFPCRTLFSKCGFTDQGDRWLLTPDHEIMMPEHVTLQELEYAG